jgi:outer membrane protein assembly factor BamC
MQLRWVACAGVLLLGACASMNDWLEGGDQTSYKSSATLPPLEVPPDLTSPTRDNRYTVPDGTAPEASTATLSGYQAGRKEAKPAAGGVLPAVEHMRIQRAGSERWLVVDQPPQKLWPLIKDFWVENGFLIRIEQPEVGVMETNWLERHPQVADGPARNILSRALGSFYSSGLRDMYRTRLEHTPDGKGTEIYVSHRGLEEVYGSHEAVTSGVGDTKWEIRPNDPGLEAEYLRRLMLRLGEQPQKATELLQASAANAPERARIKKEGVSGELLEVDEPFDRAWRRVGLALDRVGFTVEDRDRQKGLYFVRYADPDSAAKQGFFSRWFSNTRTLQTEQYRIQVAEAGTLSEVNVLNKDGAADSSKTAQRILLLLHEQLK